jgi:hypothetical protein
MPPGAELVVLHRVCCWHVLHGWLPDILCADLMGAGPRGPTGVGGPQGNGGDTGPPGGCAEFMLWAPCAERTVLMPAGMTALHDGQNR